MRKSKTDKAFLEYHKGKFFMGYTRPTGEVCRNHDPASNRTKLEAVMKDLSEINTKDPRSGFYQCHSFKIITPEEALTIDKGKRYDQKDS